ncbi:uncharacterized protein LOC123316155 [Coccinella septempunctata]|uniref:uncharacterized protein LOC123316155 n=1 Tax=Coccinella septempunctata TaxID=41139 RepID=UPI001D08111B|nr:uncharacterized protein LOC123316155 [Coccinella septempunctata]
MVFFGRDRSSEPNLGIYQIQNSGFTWTWEIGPSYRGFSWAIYFAFSLIVERDDLEEAIICRTPTPFCVDRPETLEDLVWRTLETTASFFQQTSHHFAFPIVFMYT